MMNHVMLDNETLGTAPGHQIIAIGAVRFDPRTGQIDPIGFYQAVERDGQEEMGLHTSQQTLDWWAKQSEEARAVFTDPARVPLGVALSRFHGWLPQDALVWGNGADFDNAGLAAAAFHAGHNPLWKPYNSRCYRTVKNLAPHVKLKRSGVHHNALADARCQAEHLCEIVRQTTLTLA